MMSFCCLESDNYLVFYLNELMIHRCVCALPHDVIVRLLFGGTGRLDWSRLKENTFINQDIPSKSVGSLRYGDYGLRLRLNMLLRMIKTT